jgi:hypothetical protein
MAGRLSDRPSITPILPVHGMAAARDFWTRAGLRVDVDSPDHAFIMFGDSEPAHLDLHADLDPEHNATAC